MAFWICNPSHAPNVYITTQNTDQLIRKTLKTNQETDLL